MSLAQVWENFVEKPLDAVGLLNSPIKRFAAFGIGAAGLLYVTKPVALFDQTTKKPYPSALVNQGVDAVPIDWITASVGFGVASIVFI